MPLETSFSELNSLQPVIFTRHNFLLGGFNAVNIIICFYYKEAVSYRRSKLLVTSWFVGDLLKFSLTHFLPRVTYTEYLHLLHGHMCEFHFWSLRMRVKCQQHMFTNCLVTSPLSKPQAKRYTEGGPELKNIFW